MLDIVHAGEGRSMTVITQGVPEVHAQYLRSVNSEKKLSKLIDFLVTDRERVFNICK